MVDVSWLTLVTDALALFTVMAWPIIPLWWIPVHGAPNLRRRMGILMYPAALALWVLVGYLILDHRNLIIAFRIDFAPSMNIAGIVVALAGLILQLWTIKVLSIRGITGIPEISERYPSQLVTHGPFLLIRHPTYLSHTLLFIGIFLITGVLAVGAVAVADVLIARWVIIPLEEKELLQRFGNDYRDYMAGTSRMIPRLRRCGGNRKKSQPHPASSKPA